MNEIIPPSRAEFELLTPDEKKRVLEKLTPEQVTSLFALRAEPLPKLPLPPPYPPEPSPQSIQPEKEKDKKELILFGMIAGTFLFVMVAAFFFLRSTNSGQDAKQPEQQTQPSLDETAKIAADRAKQEQQIEADKAKEVQRIAADKEREVQRKQAEAAQMLAAAKLAANLKTIIEVESDQVDFIGKVVTFNGKVSLSSAYYDGYSHSLDTRFGFIIYDGNNSAYIYGVRNGYSLSDIYGQPSGIGAKLRQSILDSGSDSVEYSLKVIMLDQFFERNSNGATLIPSGSIDAELIDFGPPLK